MEGKCEIYLHVGLGKAASTYLQYAFFPKLRGIHYVQRTKYFRSPEVIPGLQQDGLPVLVSREFDQQMEEECRWFSGHFPESKAIVVLRRHDGWIASQYRRHVKNGSPLSFEEFFDPRNDTGLWKHQELDFASRLKLLESIFGSPPLVLFHEELKSDPERFFNRIASFTGSSYSLKEIGMEAVHRSYSEKQLKVMRAASRRFWPNPIRHEKISWWQRRSRLWSCYAILYAALLVPDSAVPDREDPLIDPESLALVREKWAEDWAACHHYAGY